MKLPSFASSPPWLRFFAAAAIFLAWFIVLLVQHAPAPGAKPLLDPSQFVSIDKYVLVGLVGYHAADKASVGDALLMRLLAGVGLLAMWVWLVVAAIVPPGDLVDAMALGLFMLGVLPSTNPADLAVPGAPPQAGFARWRALAFLSGLALAGCAGFAALSPLQQASDACQSYYAAQQTVEAAKSAGKLTASQLDRYKAADAVVVKACNASPPTTAASAAELASKVGAQTAVLTAINKGK